MICEITDPNDDRLQPYRSIRHRDPASGFIAEGSLVVRRLLQSGYSVRSLLIHKDQLHRYQSLVNEHVNVYLVDPEIGCEIAGYDFHRGVLAHGDCRDYLSCDRLAEQAPAVLLGLIGISDPENVGSLLRSAAAMNIHDIVLGPRTISPYVRRVIRVSMASVFHHRFYRITDPVHDIESLQRKNVCFAATTLRCDAAPIHQFRPAANESIVLLVGNEAAGLDDTIQDACRYRVTLPMAAGTDSLNVGVAGAIFMHELISRT